MSYDRKAPDEAKRKKKLTRLGGLTEGLIAPALVKKSAYLSQLIAHWPQIAGPYANWAKPADIQPATAQDEDGILTLSIHSGRGPEAIASSKDILNRVNSFVGFQLASQLRVRQDLAFQDPHLQNRPLDPKGAVEKNTTLPESHPKATSLGEALDRLGATIEAKSKK